MTMIFLLLFFGEWLLLSNTRFTLWPEMVLYPWLNNHGFQLYRDIINPYFPLLTRILAWLTKAFGYDLKVFLWFTWGYIFLAQVVFLVILKKTNLPNKTILFAFLINILLTFIFEGNGIWFDLFCQIPLLMVYYFLQKNGMEKEGRDYIYAGFFLGMALLIKQTVVWTAIGLAIYIIATNTRNVKKIGKSLFFLFAPVGLLLITFSAFFYINQSFYDFFFWTLILPFGKLQQAPGFVRWPTLGNWLILFMIFSPVFLIWQEINKQKEIKLLLIFLSSTFLFAFPRFGYFHLTAVAPFFSIFAVRIFDKRKKYLAIYYLGLLVLISAFFVYKRGIFSIRFFEPEIYRLAAKIKKETKGESFFLQNSPQQIYFINNSLPIKPWAINFPWYFENTSLSNRVLAQLQKEKITYVIFEEGPYQPNKIKKYIFENYQITKKINKKTYILKKY